MSLKKGMSAVRESLERSQRSNSGNREETNWFYWKAGDTKAIRFLTDSNDIFVVPVHENVQTVDGKNKTFVCRQAFDSTCELCASKTYRRDVGYGVAVLREPVYEEGTRNIKGYRDVTSTYETEENGKTVTKKKPYVGIVSQGMRNFWNQIAVISEKYGSLRDREIEVLRQGAGTDTTYMAFALDKKEIEDIDTRYAKFMPDIEGFLTRIGSEEYYQAQLHGIKPEVKDEPFETVVEDEYEDEDYAPLDEESTAERLRKRMAQ